MRLAAATSRTPIGLDIGSRCIKAAQLSLGRDPAARPRLEAALVLERSEPGEALTVAEVRRLQAVLARRGFTGSQLVVSVPSEALMTSVMELPPAESDAPRGAIAAAEMARTHRIDAEAVEVAYWDLPEAGASKQPGRPAMVAACRHDRAEALLDALETPGFEVLALDLEGWALCRAARPWVSDAAPLAAVIDIGWRDVNFVLLYGRSVVYERVLGGTGIQALSETIQREHPLTQPVIDYLLGHVGFTADRAAIAPEDSRLADKLRGPLEQHFATLAQELRLSAGYATHQYPDATLDRLLLSGGGARVHGLAAHLAGALEMQVDVLTPASLCDLPMRGLGEGGEAALSVAVGLALYLWKEAR